MPEHYVCFGDAMPGEVAAAHDFRDAVQADMDVIACLQEERARPIRMFWHLRRTRIVLP